MPEPDALNSATTAAGDFRAILFDFDYTLADSSRGIAECINFALAELSLPTVSLQAARRTIGLHLDETFVRLVGEHNAGQKAAFRRHFARRADQVMNELTVLFEPVPAALERLKTQGKRLGIVSTKYRYRIEDFLRRENLLELIDVIVGGEDVARHKPDPEGLHLATGMLNDRLPEVLYVGDSLVDAEAATRAGVAFAGVLSGVTLREEFDSFPCVALLDHLGQLSDWLRTNPGTKNATTGPHDLI